MRHIVAGIVGFIVWMAIVWYCGTDIFSRGPEQGYGAILGLLVGFGFGVVSKLFSNE